MPRKTQQQLDPLMVINAYAQGIFPMADHDGTIHWYAPDPRAILEHHNLHISRSLRATIRKGIYEVRMDTAFEAVMRLCAARKETWINEAFIDNLHPPVLRRAGTQCRSMEGWHPRRRTLRHITTSRFYGRKHVSHATDASKVCLVALVEHLKARGYVLHDTQFLTPHMQSLGVTEIPRQVYEHRLRQALQIQCSWET